MYYKEHNGNYEAVVRVLRYSSYGKPQELVDLKTGVHTLYIWGYGERYLVAEIKNPAMGNRWRSKTSPSTAFCRVSICGTV